MISGFWQQLKKPIFVLAPMANVTDCAFRYIIVKYGKPDVIWTEFVSCDGLQSSGRNNIMIDLKFSKKEHPIVAQIFGSKPNNFYKTALLLQELCFDGIDINMGCPDNNVEKQGAGAVMMKNPKLAQECIAATKRGAGKLPVSVKTRIGFNKNELDTWLPSLLETDLAAITIHCRTRKEMSKAPAHWEEITRAVAIRDKYDSSPDKTLILGNGDVKDLAGATEKIRQTGCDGVMVGRGIFGNPWLFRDVERYRDSCHSDRAHSAIAQGRLSKQAEVSRNLKRQSLDPCDSTGQGILRLRPDANRDSAQNDNNDGRRVNIPEHLRVMIEHTHLFEQLLSNEKNFDIMKKHYKAYVNGFDGAKELRIRLMEEARDAATVEKIVLQYLNTTIHQHDH